MIFILCLRKHWLGSLTIMVWSGNFPRTVLTNSTKCSEYPLATSRQMYLMSGMASRMLHSFSRSACPLPELAATCWGWEGKWCIFSHLLMRLSSRQDFFLLFLNHSNYANGTSAFFSKNFNALPDCDCKGSITLSLGTCNFLLPPGTRDDWMQMSSILPEHNACG